MTMFSEATTDVAVLDAEPQTETVYIVEDDASTRDALMELIRPTGADVEAYATAEEFLANFRRQTPACLLLDENLPGLNGRELLRQLRDDGQEIPAVFVTACATTPMTVDVMRMGAVTVLEKPCCDNALRDAISQALEQDQRQYAAATARQEAAARIAELSPSEQEVLVQVLDGVPNKQIARQLGVCIRTVEARRSRIYKTMHVQSVAELARVCVAAKFID